MAYRRRYKRRFKNTTNLIKMKFQSFMDINTHKDEMQIISVSAGGKEILERLGQFFGAYKYYKIGNISVKLVPASTLPVDPTGLSYGEGEQTVDPRDQLTPGMMRITNGEDVFEDLTDLSAEAQHDLYNAMMLDPRWFKWMLQRGVKRHATPRYWQIGQLHQDKWPGAVTNIPWRASSEAGIQGTNQVLESKVATANPGSGFSSVNFEGVYGSSSPLGLFQTGHRGVLGWLPTDGFQNGQPWLCAPPEVEVMKIILPPAYKTEYYYRMYISETVYFREPVMTGSGLFYRPLDRFLFNYQPQPLAPADNQSTIVSDQYTGGNYGND